MDRRILEPPTQMTSPELRPLYSILKITIRSSFLAGEQTPSHGVTVMAATPYTLTSLTISSSLRIAVDTRAHLDKKSRL